MERVSRITGALLAVGLSCPAFAQDAPARYNLQAPVTGVAEQIHDMHTLMLLICLVIFIGVFSVMFWAVLRHRKSRVRSLPISMRTPRSRSPGPSFPS
ncbi:hypothetical protein [Thauera sp. SDU_THAU2]|uniref:hypothetical protein n=1 Tax=Thauera sp. SDU_THAU2 TaxID=3136633 RepID=UPI00311DC195